MMRAILVLLALATSIPSVSAGPGDDARAALLDHALRLLHSDEIVNLRERYAGAPLLVVNTASHCGFTRQFAGLEALHEAYREAGLRVLGFSSNDFRQEAADEAAAAEVCFVNFGVSFDMFATIAVRGDAAHPLFRELARQSDAPRWNFHKYVVDRDGRVKAAFPSNVEPDAPILRKAIEDVL